MSKEILNHLESEAYYTKVISERNQTILVLLQKVAELEKLLDDTKKEAANGEQ